MSYDPEAEVARLEEKLDAVDAVERDRDERIKVLEGERLAMNHDLSVSNEQRDQARAALKLALGALGGLTKPLYQQGALQDDVVNSIKRRDRDIHTAIEAIKACGVTL